MHQPQPLYTSLCCQRRTLTKGAVPPLRGLLLLLRQSVGSIAKQQVCALRRLFQRRAGGAVAGKDEPQPLAGCAQLPQRAAPCALPAGACPAAKAATGSPVRPAPAPFPGRTYPPRAAPASSPDCVPGALWPPAAALPGEYIHRKRASSATGCGAADKRLYCVRQRPVGAYLPARPPKAPPAPAAPAGCVPAPQGSAKSEQTKDMVSVVMGQADGVRTHQIHPARRAAVWVPSPQSSSRLCPALRHRGGQERAPAAAWVAAVPSSVMVSISSSSVVLPCYLTTNPAGAQFFLPRHKLGKALKREGAAYAA